MTSSVPSRLSYNSRPRIPAK